MGGSESSHTPLASSHLEFAIKFHGLLIIYFYLLPVLLPACIDMDQVHAMLGAPGGHKKALAALQLKRWL